MMRGGLFTAQDGNTPDGYAQSLQDVRLDNGKVLGRYGFRAFHSAPASMNAVYGFQRVLGYDGSYNAKEYWLGVGTTTGTHPWKWDPDGTTTILGSILDTSLNASPWVIRHFDGSAYFINPLDNRAPLKHDLGAVTALDSLPFSSLVGTVVVTGSGVPSWGATIPTINGRTGLSASPTLSGDFNSANISQFVTGHNSGTGASAFVIDISALAAGVRDFSRIDTIRFTIAPDDSTSTARIDPNSVVISLENAGAVALPCTAYWTTTTDSAGSFVVEAYWDAKTRADYADIRKIKVSYRVSSSGASARLRDFLFMVALWYPDTAKDVSLTAENMIEYGVTRTGAGSQESDMSRVLVPASLQSSLRTLANGSGRSAFLYIPVPSMPYKIYMRCSDGLFHQIASGTTDVSASPIEVYYTDLDGINNPVFEGPPLVAGAVSAVPYKSWFVWLYKGGRANVRHSRVGNPEKLASSYDDLSDTGRGADFTLASAFDDQPIGGAECGSVLCLLGSNGVYSQTGDSPSGMTPTRKLAEAPGCAGLYAFAPFRSDRGEEGIVYVDKFGEHVWFVGSSQLFAADASGRAVKISEAIPGEVRKWLVEATGKPVSTIHVEVDEATGDLWVINWNRALVYTQSRDGESGRFWLRHHFTLDAPKTAGWSYFSFGPRRLWALKSTGATSELAWNSSTGAYIVGANRDGGYPLSNPHYEIGQMARYGHRITWVAVQRENLNDAVTVGITTDRGGTVNVAMSAGVRAVRGPKSAQGHRYSIRVTIAETAEAIENIEVTTHVLSEGYRRG